MFAHEHLTLSAQLEQALGRYFVMATAAGISPHCYDGLSVAAFSDAVITRECIRFQPHDNLFALMLELQFLVLIRFGNLGQFSLLFIQLHCQFFKLLRQTLNLRFRACHRVFESLELLL